ncbi:MAG TPA: energy transducer TonB [Bacteroidia bacterium]|nr:energy transducer TonB [Bacteroidia bacterium]
MKKLLFILTFLLPLFAAAQTDSTSKNDDDIVFDVVEEAPSYPGGQDSMMSFIRNNVVYPDSAIKKGLQGKVYVRFIVEKDGTVSNLKAIKEFDKDCTDEAMRVVRLMKWNPGKQRGKAQRVWMVIPFTFKLK